MLSKNKIYICERSSAHILYQENFWLKNIKNFMNKKFRINHILLKLLKMYDHANIIMVHPDKKILLRILSNTMLVILNFYFWKNTKLYFFPDKILK